MPGERERLGGGEDRRSVVSPLRRWPGVRRRDPTAAAGVAAEARTLARLAVPLVLGQLATVAMNFVDAVMAGRLGAEALGAVAVGGSVWAAVMIFCLGALLALPPSVSHLAGGGRMERVGSVARQGLWLAALLSVPTVVLLRSAEPLLTAMEVQPALVPTVLGYLEGLSWGAPAFYGYLALRFLSEGLSLTRPAMYFGVLGLAVNVPANYALMYGGWGFPALGAVGCGWATAAVFWAQLAAMAAWVAWRREYVPAAVFGRFEGPRWPVLRDLLRVGAPIGVMVFLELSMFASVALLMASLGTVAVAGHQVAINFASITFMVPLGIAMATTVRVGRATGRGDRAAVRRAAAVGIALAMAWQVVAATVMLTLPRWVARIYTADPEVIAVAVELLFFAALFQLSDGLQASSAGALRGLRDTGWPMLITFVAYWVVGLPLGWWLGLRAGLGPSGMWMGLIAGLTVAAVLLATRFHRLTRG